MNPQKLYKELFSHFGEFHWWHADTEFEVLVGAILTQNTAWTNVEKAIANMKKERIITLRKVADCNLSTLKRLIKPAGFFNQKAVYLRELCRYILNNYGSLKKFYTKDLQELRKELLSLKGVGNETADTILLYSAGKPSFVIDAYTLRIIGRVFDQNMRYVEVKDWFETTTKKDTKHYQHYHALIVEFAKKYCQKKPKCQNCFLNKKCKHAQMAFK